MGLIRVNSSTDQIYIAQKRKAEKVALPPFTLAGPAETGLQSGRWFPRYAIDLESIVVTARVIGSESSWFLLKRKDPFDPTLEWNFWLIELPANSLYVPIPAISTWTFDAADWLSVQCFYGGGHQDIVISPYGTRSSLGYNEIDS